MSAPPSTNSQVCNYQSVTLQAGEQFTLPPGAVIVSATNANAITSTCVIPALETPQCYGFIVTTSRDNNGAAAFDQIFLQGIRIGTIDYPFEDVVVWDNSVFCDGCVPTTAILAFSNQVALLPFGSVFTNFWGYSDDWPESGFSDAQEVFSCCWKSLPSLMQNAYVYGVTSTDGGPAVQAFFEIKKPSEFGNNEFSSGCPC